MKAAAEWRDEIEVTEREGHGTDHCFEARCPVCGMVESSTFWGDGSRALRGAAAAVIFHMRREHPELIAPENEGFESLRPEEVPAARSFPG